MSNNEISAAELNDMLKEVPVVNDGFKASETEEQKEKNTTRKIRNTDRFVIIGARIFFALVFTLLLGYQNYAVFKLTNDAISNGSIRDLQPILSVLVPATLIESAYIAKVMVTFIFKDLIYDELKTESK